MLIQAPSGSWWLLSGERLVSITGGMASAARLAGLTGIVADSASWTNLVAAFIPPSTQKAVLGEAAVEAVALGPDEE